jgi:L-amino acid N-acyltransferase YncA
MELFIRLAQAKDLIAINDIYNQAIDTRCSTGDHSHVTIEQRESWFISHNPEKYPVLVCENNNEVIGWVCLSPYRHGRTGFKYTIEVSYYVSNNHKKKGIGSLLLEAIILKAKELNYKTMIAMLFETNTGSVKLLEKYGFQKWGCLYNVIEIDDIKYNHLYYGLKISE